jgi:hypothetical protein
MEYPTELVAKAKYEMQIFERVAQETGAELVAEVDRLREALTELRDRIKGHPAYADLTEAEEIDTGGDTAELSYLARVADAALGPNVRANRPTRAAQE